MDSRCTQAALGGSGPLCLPNGNYLGQSGEVATLPVPENYSDCSRVAKHALILGPSDHVEPNSFVPAQPVDLVLQLDPSQEAPQLSRSRASGQVDFRAPSTKSIGDFLLYLFQDRKLQPSTFEG